MKLNNITIGADPELFIINTKTNKVVSAIGIIPGEKENPYKSDDMPEGYGLETDNILAEFNIPPVTCRESFVTSIQYMKEYIDKFVKNINPDLGIKCSASEKVPTSELQSDQAKLFGCSVDYNVYTEKPNPKPDGTKTNIRSGGFHIHCGYKNPNIDTSLEMIKYFDSYLGIPSILLDKDTERRSLYGKAGCFRLCPYGFEYRTLSSYMMKDSNTLSFLWNQIMKAINAYENSLDLASEEDIIHAINTSDTELAKSLISSYNLV